MYKISSFFIKWKTSVKILKNNFNWFYSLPFMKDIFLRGNRYKKEVNETRLFDHRSKNFILKVNQHSNIK